MQGYLIDTHVFLWSLNEPSKISKRALSILENQRNTIYVSAAALWEIIIKRKKGSLNFTGDIITQLDKQSFTPLSITYQHVKVLEKIPLLHSDPFDRSMIAQALAENLTLMTRDKTILKYSEVKLLKA